MKSSKLACLGIYCLMSLFAIFNRSFLSRGIRICEINDRPQILCNELVCGKFRTVVSGDGLDVFLVGQQQMSDDFG